MARYNFFAVLILLIVGQLGFSQYASADELRPGYLQITQTTEQSYNVTFNVPAKDSNRRLALNVVFDDSVSISQAPSGHFLDGVFVSTWQIEHANNLSGVEVLVEGLRKTTTDLLLRVEYLSGKTQVYRLTPAQPSVTLAEKQNWLDVAKSYLVLGVEHILLGPDHLLFVLALLMLISDRWKLVTTITAFTIAHSITLILSSLDIITLAILPVEACIALSILFVATEIIHVQQGRESLSQRRPWLVAFSFGLLHGLGFAAVLGEIGIPDDAVFTALILFNVGVEIGQLIFVAAAILMFAVLKKFLEKPPLWLARTPAYLIGGMASFWFVERVASFWTA